MLTSKIQWMIVACVISIFATKPADAYEPPIPHTCLVFHKPDTTNPTAKELFEKLDGVNTVKMCRLDEDFSNDGNRGSFSIAKPIFVVGNIVRFQSIGIGGLPSPPFSDQTLADIQTQLQNARVFTFVCLDPQRCNRPYDSGFVIANQYPNGLSDAAYPFIPEIGANIDGLLADYAKSLPRNKWREKRWVRQLRRGMKTKKLHFESVSDELIEGYGLVIELDIKSPLDDYWVVIFLTDGQNLRIGDLQKAN